MLLLLTGYYKGENKHMYRLTLSHKTLKTTNYLDAHIKMYENQHR